MLHAIHAHRIVRVNVLSDWIPLKDPGNCKDWNYMYIHDNHIEYLQNRNQETLICSLITLKVFSMVMMSSRLGSASSNAVIPIYSKRHWHHRLISPKINYTDIQLHVYWSFDHRLTLMNPHREVMLYIGILVTFQNSGIHVERKCRICMNYTHLVPDANIRASLE